MTGLCGWIGGNPDAPQETLQRMGAALCRFDGTTLSRQAGLAFGLATSGNDKTRSLIEQGNLLLALFGHVRWEGPGSRQTDIEAAGRAFLSAYVDQGTDALRGLKGDFGLALIDRERQEALLAIDRIGVCNLIYQQDRDSLVFGSTADALAAHPGVRHEVANQGLYDYVYFHMVPGPNTVFRDQYRLLPGHFLRWRQGKLSVQPYWEMHFTEDQTGSINDLKKPFLAALREGVATAADDQSCGAFLSGGTDSSTVAGLLKQLHDGRSRTYSIGFDAAGFDEMEYARLASRHFNTEHHEYYVTPDDVVQAIPAIADVYDQPFGNASAIPTYFCARMAKADGVTRLLGGDGGDELFGGNARYGKQYQFSLYNRIPALLRRGLIEPLTHGIPGGHRLPLIRKARSYIAQASLPMPARYESYNLLERLGPANVFTPDFLASIDTGHPLALMKGAYDSAHADSLINRMLALDIKFTLADNDLPKVTRMCELAGVDVTFPLLHESVVDFSATLAPAMKLKGTKLRYFFKEALRDFLPNEIITKEKHGFGLPVGAWLQSHPPLRELAGDSLQRLKQRNIVRPEFIDSLFSDHLQSHAGYYGTMIWILMMLELWFEKHT
ncbi:MAG: asparagine synthase-related protein [Rhodocyclaceae bacterium]|nr:asparagine synthase-related protein [Rhodocyclaceae bacterium]